jgi:TetR/AcrR family transcriptional repressor of nem operon
MSLAYRNGFGNTTLAEVAKAAKVPPGNLYYYFKTKEEIGEAIVELRFSELSTIQQELGTITSPKERLCSFVLLALKSREIVAQKGCPMGTFCSELNKEGGLLGKKASRFFIELLAWVEAQFRDFCEKGEARGHAVHLVSALQGATVLANCSKNPDLIKMEAVRLVDWLRSL